MAFFEPKISEAAFQDQLIRRAQYCNYLCYHTYDSRRSQSGFPDLVMVRLWPQPQLIFAELKVGKNKRSKDQDAWANMLEGIAEHNPDVEYHLWYPRDTEIIDATVRGPTRDELDALEWQRQNPELYGGRLWPVTELPEKDL